MVRITGPGLGEGGARPLAARAARGGVGADAHKKIRSKTPQGSARYELRSFLSEWCGSRAASRAALQPRRVAKLAAQRCLGGSPASTQGCQQGCQAAGAGLPGWQRRAALRPRRAALPCGQPADSGASSGDNSRSWTGRARREGVPGCEGSLPSRGREPGRRIRWGHCPHPGACRRRHLRTCSGPSQPRVCFAVLSVRRVKGRGTRPAPNLAK